MMLGGSCSPCCGVCSLPGVPSSVQVTMSGGLPDPAYAVARGSPYGYGTATSLALWCKCAGVYELTYLRQASGLHDYFYADDEVAMLFRISTTGRPFAGFVSAGDTLAYGSGAVHFWNWSLQVNSIRWRQMNSSGYVPGMETYEGAPIRYVFSKTFLTAESLGSVPEGVVAASNTLPSTLRDSLLDNPDAADGLQIAEQVVSDQIAVGQQCNGSRLGVYRSEWEYFGIGPIASVRVDHAVSSTLWSPDVADPSTFHDVVACGDVSTPKARFRVGLLDFPDRFDGDVLRPWLPADSSTFPAGEDYTTSGVYIVDGFPTSFVISVDEVMLQFAGGAGPAFIPYECVS